MIFILRILFLVIFVSKAIAQDFPIANQMNELWRNGQKMEVLEIANERLNLNENDVLGLLLKLEYEIEFLDINNIESTADKLLLAAGGVDTEEFRKKLPRLKLTVNRIKIALPYYTPELLAEDQGKSNITGKPLSFGGFVEALEKDGWLADVVVQ